MTDAASARIFISYSRKDGAGAAARLREDMEAQGLLVEPDIGAMEGFWDWKSHIEAALKSNRLQHFVLVVTPAVLESPIARWQVRLAHQEGKVISPAKVPGLSRLDDLPHWLGHVCYDLDIPEERSKLMSVLAAPGKRHRVPMMAPEVPADFVQRSAEFDALKRKLNRPGDAVALCGGDGCGKTTLACGVAHDPDIASAYFDGVLWVELGEKTGNLLSTVSDLIETITGERHGLENLNAATAKFSDALCDRRFLLIIDDAWREQDLHPFLQGGRNTTRLITTQRDGIPPLSAARQQVDAMQGGEALELLAWGLPQNQTATHARALQALAVRLGEWAQILKLVNGFLRDRVVKNRQPLDQAIAGVNRRLDEKCLAAFYPRNEADRTQVIATTIGVSLDLLDDSERARFAELAIFPEDVDVPIGVAAAFWAKTGGLDELASEGLLSSLESLSLLTAVDFERRSFRLHTTVRRFLQEQMAKEALALLHRALLDAMEAAITSGDVAAKRYYFLYRPAHLAMAGDRAALDALLLDPGWLQAKLDAIGTPQALIADYEQFGRGWVQDLICRTLRMTSWTCARDGRQLIPQLHGRLLSEGAFAHFCADGLRHLKRPAIVTSWPSLKPPSAESARLKGHRGGVMALALLPDGRLASGSRDKTIRLWDLRTGAETARFDSLGGSVNALAALPDGRLANGSDDGAIRLWNLKTGVETARLEGHGILWLWDAETGAVTGTLEGWRSSVNALALLMDGCVASGSDDGTIRIWDLETGAGVTKLDGHAGSVRALVVLPDGLASSSDDGTIRVWCLKTGAETARFESDGGSVRVLTALPDGRLVSGCEDGSIRFWDLETGAEVARIRDGCEEVTALAALPDGYLACSFSEGCGVELRDLKNGATTWIEGQHKISILKALPDGRLASGSEDGTIQLWDLEHGEKSANLKGIGCAEALAVLPDGLLASGARNGTIRLWNPKTGEPMGRLEGHFGHVAALAALPDGRLVSASHDGTMRLWDPETATETARIEAYASFHGELVVLPESRFVASTCSDDTMIRLWDLETGCEAAKLEGHGRLWSALALLPDGRLASASADATIRLWDCKTGAETARIEGFCRYVQALAVLPDGRLALGSNDRAIRLWDLKTGAETTRLEGHTGFVWALAALPDGRLASGSDDKTVRLWDTKCGTELARVDMDCAVKHLTTLGNGRLAASDSVQRLHWLEILD